MMEKKILNRVVIIVAFFVMVCILAALEEPKIVTIVKDCAALAGIYIAVKGKGGSNGE